MQQENLCVVIHLQGEPLRTIHHTSTVHNVTYQKEDARNQEKEFQRYCNLERNNVSGQKVTLMATSQTEFQADPANGWQGAAGLCQHLFMWKTGEQRTHSVKSIDSAIKVIPQIHLAVTMVHTIMCREDYDQVVRNEIAKSIVG